MADLNLPLMGGKDGVEDHFVVWQLHDFYGFDGHRATFLDFDGQLVAEAVDTLGITFCQTNVIICQVDISNPIFIICPHMNGSHFDFCFLPFGL